MISVEHSIPRNAALRRCITVALAARPPPARPVKARERIPLGNE